MHNWHMCVDTLWVGLWKHVPNLTLTLTAGMPSDGPQTAHRGGVLTFTPPVLLTEVVRASDQHTGIVASRAGTRDFGSISGLQRSRCICVGW